MQYLIAFCSRPEAASDAISGKFMGPIVLDKRVKFDCHRKNGSREISPEGVGGGIFDVFFRHNFRPEAGSVTSSPVWLCEGSCKFCDCRSNRSRDIRLPQMRENSHDHDAGTPLMLRRHRVISADAPLTLTAGYPPHKREQRNSKSVALDLKIEIICLCVAVAKLSKAFARDAQVQSLATAHTGMG